MTTTEGILRAGELLNNTYVIEKLIGSGGTGEVYLAKNIVSGRKFAIKILKQEFSRNEAFINLMRREADVLHNVIDDAVVRYNELLRSEMHGGFVFLVMEFIEGQQLAEIMQASGAIDADSLLLIARRMGQGLMAAHAQNAFHRDISPDNIILPGGDPAKAKLIDFGIARDISENAQTVVGGGFAGKYQYASPEQLNGDVDARSDLYSLGVTLLNAYRGKSSQIGSSLMEIVQVKSQRVDSRDVPGQLGTLIARLAEPNPEDRFQSAAEMVQWLDGNTAPATAPAALSPVSEAKIIAPSRPKPGLQPLPEEPGGGGFGKILLLLVLAAAGGAGWYFGLGPGREMLFPPAFEQASPYRLAIGGDKSTRVLSITGNTRGPEAGTSMLADIQRQFGEYTLSQSLENASGAPFDNWEQIAVALASEARPLDTWQLEMVDGAATLSGEAADESTAQTVKNAFEARAAAESIIASATLSVAVQPLLLAPLNEMIKTYESCGPLRITGGNGISLAPDERLTVSGIIARESDVDVFDLVLGERAGGRGIDYNLAVLNVPVCEIEAILPPPQNNGLELLYAYGQKDAEVGSNPFREGENPVIDVLLPGDATGFLYAFYIDAEGQVYHLLPHQSRPTNTLPPIGERVDGKIKVRLTYPVSEASTEKLGFRAVAPFGTNMVVAVLSQTPLFEGLRPRAESIDALKEALAPRRDVLTADSTLIVSRYLVTDP